MAWSGSGPMMAEAWTAGDCPGSTPPLPAGLLGTAGAPVRVTQETPILSSEGRPARRGGTPRAQAARCPGRGPGPGRRHRLTAAGLRLRARGFPRKRGALYRSGRLVRSCGSRIANVRKPARCGQRQLPWAAGDRKVVVERAPGVTQVSGDLRRPEALLPGEADNVAAVAGPPACGEGGRCRRWYRPTAGAGAGDIEENAFGVASKVSGDGCGAHAVPGEG